MNTFDHLFSDLNDEQKQAVTQSDGPLLIVAGAGTGKTTVITRRIAWLILSGKCKAEEILALTFTEKAAGEMEERVDRLLPYGYVNLWISTFHSFCQRMLERHGLDIGIPNQFKLLDQTASWLLVYKNLARFDLHYYRPIGNPTKFIHALLQHFSRAKDEAILPAEYMAHAEELIRGSDSETRALAGDGEAARISEIASAYHVYQQLLLENNSLDFGDLLLYTRELFLKRPAILERYREQFKYVLVDEFQDTNWVQYEIIKLLAAPRDNLTIVADDDQAIFLFRGASYYNIVQFKKDYPKSREVFLVKNYRSRQNILDCAYDFIQHNNPDRLEWQLAHGGTDRPALSKKLIAHTEGSGTIEHIHCTTLDEECGTVVQKILSLKKEDTALQWSDIALLVRSNDSARPFIDRFEQAGIPYQFFALKGLYTKPIILDLIAYCTVLSNYHESSFLWRVLNIPFFAVGTRSLIALSHYAHKQGLSLWSACEKIDLIEECDEKDVKKIKEIVGIIEKHTQLARTKKPAEVFLTCVRDSGYLAYLTGAETEKKRDALAHLEQFYKKVRQFQADCPTAHLKDFLELIALEQEAGERGGLAPNEESGPDGVKIMTVHSAKGLEFRHVFIVNLVDRRFPTIERDEAIALPSPLVKETEPSSDAHLLEERRLFYVALTRAKESIFLTSAQDYGGSRAKKLSRFLSELKGTSPCIGIEGLNEKNTKSPLKNILDDSSRSASSPATPPSFPIPSVFSFSQLAAFQKCPLQYKFGFIVRIPIFGRASLSFGKTMHATLQHFFEKLQTLRQNSQQSLFNTDSEAYTDSQRVLPSIDELFSLYEECWIDEWYTNVGQKKEYREKGREMLRRFYKECSESLPHPKALERDFTIKVGGKGKNYTIKGRIDRVDECGDGTVEIIDYKTGEAKNERLLKPEDKEQLMFYQIASETVFGETPVRLTYHYLDDGKKISFLGTPEEKNKLLEKAATIIEKIQSSDFAATPGHQCKYCDFKDICEYRK